MALPPGGWITMQEPSDLTDFPLPEDYVVVYQDQGFFGRPSLVFTDVHGSPEVITDFGMRSLRLEVRIRNAYDVALVDRIE